MASSLAGAPMRVIVVDGHQATADSAALLFKWWGHHAHSVYANESALQTAFEVKPDLMLIDLAHHEAEALGMAERLRRQDGLEFLQMVALSAAEDLAQWRRAKSAGFSDYLVKPVPATQFLRVLLNARAAIARSKEKARHSREIAARSKDRNASAEAGIHALREAIQNSQQSLERQPGAQADLPRMY